MHAPPLNRIAWIGNYVPRRCGIATYTRDLRCAVAAHLPAADCPVIAMNDGETRHAYPTEVTFTCADHEPAAHRQAAEFVNLLEPDVVSLQHEYGIFGGPSGGQVLDLLQQLRAPVHTTLHTVLATPTAEQRDVLAGIVRLSTRLAVMTDRGRALLRDLYGVPEDRVDVIPHGIPDMEFVDPNFHKDRFGVEGRRVLLTFGLLSPSKGIEQAIAALPAIVARHPDAVYVVLGATHPHLVRREGERYRESLQRLAADEPHHLPHPQAMLEGDLLSRQRGGHDLGPELWADLLCWGRLVAQGLQRSGGGPTMAALHAAPAAKLAAVRLLHIAGLALRASKDRLHSVG